MWAFRLRRFDRDVGLVLGAFAFLLAFENVVIGFAYRAEFAGSWEMASARMYLSPIGLALSVPFAISVVALGRLAAARRAWALAIVGALFSAAVAIGVSTGRHLAPIPVRAPFVGVAAVAGFWASGRLAVVLPQFPVSLRAMLGGSAALLAWAVDAFLFERLYPVLHLALFYIALGGLGMAASVARRSTAAQSIALTALVATAASIAWSPDAARLVRGEDNLRRILVEHAPFLGRSVIVASQLAPPPPIEDDRAATATLTNLRDRGGARVLDWRGHDIVLITIDALRADHVSSYGYARKTTPNIDALAARGVRFSHAYCPTPHTSYSITSMMTGKYMKPLLALDTQDDSETWPVQLRRYGYRTAAFYPPAVFFIDEHRFRELREEQLGFEYAKEEFAPPDLRRSQIEAYLQAATPGKPLFLWVHLFEPHEPYELHPEHEFTGDPRVDAYDSEVAAADEFVGDVVRLVGERRPPGTIFIVSADHGEEHGDHGGRYHGTTVYEEQVRVPLVIVAPDAVPRVVEEPVQTIDLLPTSLSALDVPIPPRLRGRDLGPAIAGVEQAGEQGFAFAETDDYTLVARGADRLICTRKIGSCTLFDVAQDPAELRAVEDRAPRVDELKKLTAAIERETGRLEASALPDALRRGMQGDRDAAEEIAPLLDDVRVDIRRAAARCAFRLKAPEIAPQLRRAAAKDDDGEVRQWATLALARLGESAGAPPASGGWATAGAPSAGGGVATPSVEALLRSHDDDERAAAALALAERGDPRGEAELVARWTAGFSPGTTTPGELDEARELLAAFAKIKARTATPVLVRSLPDVRLRPHLVETLAAIGDFRAKEPLLAMFTSERYVHLRALEARALVRLGARERLFPPLARFAGVPEPMADAIAIAREARLLTYEHGGHEWVALGGGAGAAVPPQRVDVRLKSAKAGAARLLVVGGTEGPLSGGLGTAAISDAGPTVGLVHVVEIEDVPAGEVSLDLSSPGGIVAAWLVPRADEIPPPPPQAWTPPSSSPTTDGGL